MVRYFKWLAWIGASDNETDGQFVWEDGTPVNWTNWKTGERSNLLFPFLAQAVLLSSLVKFPSYPNKKTVKFPSYPNEENVKFPSYPNKENVSPLFRLSHVQLSPTWRLLPEPEVPEIARMWECGVCMLITLQAAGTTVNVAVVVDEDAVVVMFVTGVPVDVVAFSIQYMWWDINSSR